MAKHQEPTFIRPYKKHKAGDPCTIRHPSTLAHLKAINVIDCADSYLRRTPMTTDAERLQQVKSTISATESGSESDDGEDADSKSPEITDAEQALIDVNPEDFRELKKAMGSIEGLSAGGTHEQLMERREEYLASRGVNL